MKPFEVFDKITLLCQLIEQQHTGTPIEFASRLGISRTSLYEILDEIRSRDIDIKYSRSRQTFFYVSPVNIEIRFTIKKIAPVEIRNLTGGTKKTLPFFVTDATNLSLQYQQSALLFNCLTKI